MANYTLLELDRSSSSHYKIIDSAVSPTVGDILIVMKSAAVTLPENAATGDKIVVKNVCGSAINVSRGGSTDVIGAGQVSTHAVADGITAEFEVSQTGFWKVTNLTGTYEDDLYYYGGAYFRVSKTANVKPLVSAFSELK